MNGKVLVVGGTGYVGCVLVEELLAKGYSVKVLDRMFFGHAPAEHFLDRVELIREDMRDLNESHVEGCSAVINIGGLSNDPTAEFNPRANEELNTHASIRVAEMAKRAGIARLVFASTCSIYDRGVGEEARDVLLDEESDIAPRAAYATSKLAAERAILGMADADYAAVSFRKGTIFGFSPRMRYDLVVNAFVKGAMESGRFTLHYGGEMWRPLIDVKDVCRAYVMALECDADLITGQIFNLTAGNFRIAELGLRVKGALAEVGVQAEMDVDYSYRLVRSYRVSGDKILKVLGFQPKITIEESVVNMVQEIRRWGYTDFSNPRYYNIDWMKLLEESVDIVRSHGYVLSKPDWDVANLAGGSPSGERTSS
ncbi:MAG TPA: SDR family oxidoreductase [Actinomycetota bacterium]|jgi:nucleoside-diphosphate-sugar epimerase